MGILYINKPKGITSFDICFKLRSVLGTTKIGHTGTLDPNATGVMIVLFGKDTKANQFLVSDSKGYIGKCKLGIETDTLDIDGNIIDKKDTKCPLKSELEAVFKSFEGFYDQIPPLTSAIKIGGKKLYEYQREGIEIKPEPRRVEIKSLELLDINDDSFSFKCEVSSGTYIRSLLKDILDKFGVIGTLEELTRTKINDIDIKDCDNLDDVLNGNYREHNLYDILSKKYYVYESNDTKYIKDGKPLKLDLNEDKILVVNNKEVLAIYQKENGLFRSLRGLF